jgi:hypothetical protein
MNRYKIVKSGTVTHSYTAENALPAQPEWGENYEVVVVNIDNEIEQENERKELIGEYRHRLQNIAQMVDADVSNAIVKEAIVKLVKLLCLKDGLK